ncbi:unnamed protein product [Bathycoccus prasinos]
MNAKEDKEQQSTMSLLSWLSEVTNQRSSIASVKELKSCSVLLVLCENLLSKEQDLTKRTKKTNDDDDDDYDDDNNNNKSPSDSVLLHVALDELNVGGEYVKAVLEEDEFGILEVIQKLKEKYDLREEVEKLSKDFLHGYDDKKGEEDAKEEEDNEEEEEDDEDVFGTRDGDALDELDDLGFDHIVAPNARGSSSTSLPPAPPNVSSPVKFINAFSLLGGERTFETSPPFKNSNANNIITRRNDDEEDREEDGNDLFERRSPIQRAPSFMRWNKSTEEEEEEEEENEENQVSSVSKVRRNPEPLAWFSPLNPDEAAVSKAETKLSVAEIALLRRGKASLSSSFASGEKKKVDKTSSPYFTTKSAEGSRRASSPSVSPSFSKASANVGKRTNASEIKIALKFGALAGESDQMKRLRNEALQALETENAPGAKHQFIILFSETSENSKTYRGLYKVSKSESTGGDGRNIDGVALRKIHGTSEKVPDALRSSRILKTLKFNLASKMWHALLHDEVDANAMAVVLKPPKKKK